MRDIKINNEVVLESLNKFHEFLVEKYRSGALEKEVPLMAKNHTRDRWLADDYLERIISRGRGHNGYPESMHSYTGMSADGHDIPGGYEESILEYRQKSSEMNMELMTELSAHRSTLTTIYPPGGWISWHNNANAAGYNIIFSWSETGDGWFDYWDLKEKKRVRVQDVPGWQCKMGYFGSYEQPEKLCYHAASTDCLRISVAYVFREAEDIWEQIIEDVENPL